MKRAPAAALLLAACSRPATTQRTERCETCHASEARTHEASFHRVAFTDATYQASLALEAPKEHAFCNGCHAPDGEQAGVGCPSCHGAAHTNKRLAAADTCARCHQFTFDDGRADLVQRTVEEHAASDLSGVTCATCHMPRRDHAFEAGHSLAFLRRSVLVTARRTGASGKVRVVIEPRAGHAFPTGDMFRRARLLVFGETEEGAIVASTERVFGRTWGHLPNGLRQELADTRIRGRFEEDLDLVTDRPLARVRFVLLFERVLAQRGAQISLASSDAIAEGLAQ